MFGLFQNKKCKEVANRIGVEIHRQLISSLKVDEAMSSRRLSSAFITGYLCGFIRISFTVQGYEGEKMLDKYFKHICNGVLPGKLYNIVKKQLKALDFAKELGKEEEIKAFEYGFKVGLYDSGVFSVFAYNPANNMFNYLTNKKLLFRARGTTPFDL